MSDKETKQTAMPDWSAIAFPSDRITIAQIRKEQPGMFTQEVLRDAHAANFNAINTVRTELILAAKVWALTVGQPDPQPEYDRLEEMVMLNDDYVRYGLSTGMAMTRQMVRDLERAVVEQARIPGGQGR